jgi:hypothetical protein
LTKQIQIFDKVLLITFSLLNVLKRHDLLSLYATRNRQTTKKDKKKLLLGRSSNPSAATERRTAVGSHYITHFALLSPESRHNDDRPRDNDDDITSTDASKEDDVSMRKLYLEALLQ